MSEHEEKSQRTQPSAAVTSTHDGAVVLLVLGVLLAILGFPWVSRELLGIRAVSVPTLLFELFTHIGLPAVIAGVGWQLARSSFTGEGRWLTTKWAFGGIVVLAVIVTWAYIDELTTGGVGAPYYHDLQLYGSLGGVFGAVSGLNRAQADRNRHLAELADEQRESLTFLHHLLRHDIRNGMTVIGGYADLLEHHVEPSGEKALEAIEKRSQHVFELLDEAGTVVESVTTEPSFTPVSLQAVVASAVDAVTAAETDATVITDIPADLMVAADHLFGQAIENLVRNAVEHSSTGRQPAADDAVEHSSTGNRTVSEDAPEHGSTETRSPTVRVTARRRGEYVELRVADDGPGIPPERHDRVFSLGERGPDSRGDGIGLYIVARLAERYGGTVDIEENEPSGSVFLLALPAA
jgi:signal transduction histidine kinase